MPAGIRPPARRTRRRTGRQEEGNGHGAAPEDRLAGLTGIPGPFTGPPGGLRTAAGTARPETARPETADHRDVAHPAPCACRSLPRARTAGKRSRAVCSPGSSSRRAGRTTPASPPPPYPGACPAHLPGTALSRPPTAGGARPSGTRPRGGRGIRPPAPAGRSAGASRPPGRTAGILSQFIPLMVSSSPSRSENESNTQPEDRIFPSLMPYSRVEGHPLGTMAT